LKEDILSLLLQAEYEYHSTVKHAVRDAEKYVENSRKEQAKHIEELRQKQLFFEKTENEIMEQTLLTESKRIEEKAARLKEQMKARQEDKADMISKRLKEEVLSLLWR
jgi:hypothetical protein